MSRRRWPGWVYGTGEEPDYRYSFANERTFLAWVRTGLAFLAAGVAVDAVPLTFPGWLKGGAAAVLTLLGLSCAVGAWFRWARAERSMRRHEPLGGLGLSVPLVVVVVAVAVAVVVQGL
jgi:putative membrane protein